MHALIDKVALKNEDNPSQIMTMEKKEILQQKINVEKSLMIQRIRSCLYYRN